MHDKIFDLARNRARSHDRIFIVISNPDLNNEILKGVTLKSADFSSEDPNFANRQRSMSLVDELKAGKTLRKV